MDKKVFCSTCNISYFIGQIVSANLQLVCSKFPTNFFKSIIKDGNQSVEAANSLEENTDEEFLKKVPSLSIVTEYSLDSVAEENPHHNDWMHIFKRRGSLNDLRGIYPVVFSDVQSDKYIFTLPKKHSVKCEFSIRLESKMSMWDVLAVLKHSFPIDSLFYLENSPMVSVIPNSVIYALAGEYDKNLSLTEENDDFLQILRSGSFFKIDEVIDPSKGNSFFTFNHFTNILNKISMPSGSVNKEGLSESEAVIKFTIESIFDAPTNFAVETETISDEYANVINTIDANSVAANVNFTVRFNTPDEELSTGEKLVFFKGFLTDAPSQKDLEKIQLGENISPIDFSLFITDTDEFDYVPIGFEFPEIQEGVLFSKEETENGNCLTVSINENSSFELFTNQLTDVKFNKPYNISLNLASSNDYQEISLTVYNINNKEEKQYNFEITQNNNFSIAELNNIYLPKGCKFKLSATNNENEQIVISIKSFEIREEFGLVLSTEVEDFLYLETFLSDFLKYAASKNTELGQDNNELFKIKVFQTGKKYLDSNQIEMDWSNYKLTLSNPLFNTTHYLAIYADLNKLKELNSL
jgi:hypothetical protein